MKIEMIKEAGGVFRPVNDLEYEKTTKFKTGCQYTVDIPNRRNPKFHGKVFAFFNFCFEYWNGENTGHKYKDHSAQFDIFRQELTVLAGYRDVVYTLKGDARVRAKSLSFGSMSQEEFEQCYNALINAAIDNVFNGCSLDVQDKLYGFF